MKDNTAVTIQQPFDCMYDVHLFSVNAGVPTEQALERAADLVLYTEALSAADAFVDKAMESALVQTLTEIANALLKASHVGKSKPAM